MNALIEFAYDKDMLTFSMFTQKKCFPFFLSEKKNYFSNKTFVLTIAKLARNLKQLTNLYMKLINVTDVR